MNPTNIKGYDFNAIYETLNDLKYNLLLKDIQDLATRIIKGKPENRYQEELRAFRHFKNQAGKDLKYLVSQKWMT